MTRHMPLHYPLFSDLHITLGELSRFWSWPKYIQLIVPRKCRSLNTNYNRQNGYKILTDDSEPRPATDCDISSSSIWRYTFVVACILCCHTLNIKLTKIIVAIFIWVGSNLPWTFWFEYEYWSCDCTKHKCFAIWLMLPCSGVQVSHKFNHGVHV